MEFMKTAEKIFKIITFLVLGISIIYIIISTIDFINLGKEFYTFEQFYAEISKYSGIHKFMLAFLAAYLGLSRLRLSSASHQKTLSQLKLTEEEIFRKRETETKNETLKKCEYYLTEIQIQFKTLVQNDNYSGIPVIWSKLAQISRNSLEINYNTTFKKLQQAEVNLKGESLITLYKLEAFSTIFLKGELDLDLGKKVIGEIYTKQIGYLLGLIAFYRPEENDRIFENVIELYERWK